MVEGEDGDSEPMEFETDGERSENVYETVFRAIDDAVFLIDVERTDGDYAFTFRRNNASHRQQTGISEDELRGQTPRGLLGDEQGSEVFEHYRQCVERAEPTEYEETIEFPAGTTHWETRLTPITEDGRVVQIVGTARNISERKERERELQRVHHRFETVLETMSIAVFLKDTDGRYLLMNQACRDLFGIDESQDVTGLTDEDLLPSDRADEARSDDRHVIETKEPIEIEETVPTAEGETVRLTRKSPVCDEEGAVEAICGVSNDVTAQKERERELEFYERIINAFDDIVTVIEPDGTITYVSPSVRRVLGYDPEDLIDESGYNYQPEETTEAVQTAIQDVIEHPEDSRTIQTKFQRSDDSMCWIEFKIQNRLDDDVIDGLLVNSRDITERKEYERTLERQRNNLEILNQVVRHDIRNDMTVVGGRANLLEEHVEAEGREDLEAIQNATESAIELTKTARDLSEVMLSTEEDIEPVRLDRHLDPLIENARSKFDTAVITTEDRIPDVRVRGNDLIEAVFRNLVQNAVVHNDKEAPEVQISTALDEETATVAIADNGPGIPDDRKEAIFGKGQKGLDSPGTGLGLYLVRTLVEQYGGDVWVEDNDPEGSVFYVELPLAEEL